MSKGEVKMTRQQMQTEALVIERLLDAVLAMQCDEDRQDSCTLIETALERADRLNRALDSIHEGKGKA